MSHTPGPWIYVHLSTGDGYVAPLAGGMAIAQVYQTPNGAADARLIASAPDLLEACASVWLMLSTTGDNELRLIADECRNAIAKAVGQS